MVLAYDVPSLSANLHWIGLMTYDFHGSWESTTGHNSPLYQHPGDTSNANTVRNTNIHRGRGSSLIRMYGFLLICWCQRFLSRGPDNLRVFSYDDF